jgi:hypothetical protein
MWSDTNFMHFLRGGITRDRGEIYLVGVEIQCQFLVIQTHITKKFSHFLVYIEIFLICRIEN